MTQFELQGPEASFTVDVRRVEGGFQVSVGGKTLVLRLERSADPGVLVAHFADKPTKVILEEANDRRVALVIDGERLTFEKPMPTLAASPTPDQGRTSTKDLLVSPMPGRIIGVSVKNGDVVKAGDPVVMVESMKMESVIKADRDAQVVEVLVSGGSTVKRGQALVRFSTAGPS
jgi:biotin carboxyl carrier protein